MAKIEFLENGGCTVDGHELSYDTLVSLVSAVQEHDMKQQAEQIISSKYGETAAEKLPDDLLDDIVGNAMECFNEHFGEEIQNAVNVFASEIKAELNDREQEAG